MDFDRRYFLDVFVGDSAASWNVMKVRLLDHMEQRMGARFDGAVKVALENFVHKLKVKYAKQRTNWESFRVANADWLSGKVSFRVCSEGGRPVGDISNSSVRTKIKRTENLRAQYSIGELAAALEIAYRKIGNYKASSIVGNIGRNPDSAKLYSKGFVQRDLQVGRCKQISGKDALAMVVEANLSRSQYDIIKRNLKKALPNYKVVAREKKACVPQEGEGATYTDTSAEVKLQVLVDRTLEALVEAHDIAPPPTGFSYRLDWKWGMDGAGGHSTFNQVFEGDSTGEKDDEEESAGNSGEVTTGVDKNVGLDGGVFMIGVVPVRLVMVDDKQVQVEEVWVNKKAGAAESCRILKFKYGKETEFLIKTERNYVLDQINSLGNTQIVRGDSSFSAFHEFRMTMVDMKICNVVTDNRSTRTCYCCGNSQKSFNDLSIIGAPLAANTYEFGLSTLHALMRSMEFFLRLGYKKAIMKYTAVTEEEKKLVKDRKREVRKLFWDRLHLVVDTPRNGSGTSNTGNTARIFFAYFKITAEILDINEDIIRRMGLILEVIRSSSRVDVVALEELCTGLFKDYISEYKWYLLSPTVHKILIHAPFIIESCSVPIGDMSEEALESRHKHYRSYRANFSRKFSRIATNKDIFARFWLSSDPIINSKRKFKKTALVHSEEALKLFLD